MIVEGGTVDNINTILKWSDMHTHKLSFPCFYFYNNSLRRGEGKSLILRVGREGEKKDKEKGPRKSF